MLEENEICSVSGIADIFIFSLSVSVALLLIQHINTCKKSCFPNVLGRFLLGIILDCNVLLADKM